MKTQLRISLTTITLLTLIACASTPSGPAEYKSSYSRAYNLAQAGGISDARDVQRKHLSESEVFNLVNNTSLLMSGNGASWSGGPALGASLLLSTLEPKSSFAEDPLFGWMPQAMAANTMQARTAMSERAARALKQGLDNLGYSYEVVLENYDQKSLFGNGSAFMFSQIAIVEPAKGCPAPSETDHYSQTCYVTANIKEPTQGHAPQFEGGQPAWVFKTEGVKASRITLASPDNVELDKPAILQAISAELPDWVYIFLAQDEERPPVVLSGGEVELFLEPGE